MSAPDPLPEFGPYRLDPGRLVLWRDGEIVALAPKALHLLATLVEHAGEVVPKRELMARVWPDAHVVEANLSVTVAALRKALGPQEDGRPYVQTLSRRGYRFAGTLQGTASGLVTLAVLPFQGIGPGVESHLGLGIADALIGRLTRLDGLRVRPTGAVAHYAASPRPPRAAADELQVDGVIDGTIQGEGGRLMVSVQLVPRPGRIRPWAGRFEGDPGELFALQGSVADQVADAVGAQLAPRSPAAPPPLHVPVPAAFEAYLRGRYLLARFDLEGLTRAFGYFGEAAQLDPAYAAPRAGLASAHVVRGFGGSLPPHQAWQAAAECAELALARDPGSTEARIAQAFVALFRDWDWSTATRQMEEAVAGDPHAPGPRLWLGLLRAMQGDARGARREVEEAREADPLSPTGTVLMSLIQELEGDARGARTLALRAAESHPERALAHLRVGANALARGRPREAIAPLRRAVELTSQGAVARCELVRALAASGQTAEARSVLDEVETLARSVYVSPLQRGLAWNALGDRAQALDHVEEALRSRDPWVVVLHRQPRVTELLGDPRLRALAAPLRGR